MTSLFHTLLEAKRHLLADGAMGTNLFDMGLANGEAPEFWCLEQPDKLKSLHSRFLEAGSDIILTNSFGGNRYRLKLHNAENRVTELNSAAARIACAARTAYQQNTNRPIAIAGSIGPTGELLEPVGPLSYGNAVAAFAEQANGLAAGGVDVFWIETLSSQEELQAALDGVHQATPDLPVVATLSFDTNGRTMMGLEPAVALQSNMECPNPAQAFGANCGTGASNLLAAIREMRVAQDLEPHNTSAVPLIAKANCGIPAWIDDKIVYSGTPEIMADYARLSAALGVKIIGGCCGSKPEHVAAMAKALAALDDQQASMPSLEDIVSSLGPIDVPKAQDDGPTPRRRRRQ